MRRCGSVKLMPVHRITHAVSGKVDEGRAVHVWHLNDGRIDHLEVFPPESEDFYR